MHKLFSTPMTTTLDIRSLIPHAGSMCLLDGVTAFDERSITCSASSHTRSDNPLRHNAQLSIHAGIEYAAQAVAAHGTLLARQRSAAQAPRAGMIAVLTDIRWQVERLDTIAAALTVTAEKLADLPQGLHYRFALSAEAATLLEGELIVALQEAQAA